MLTMMTPSRFALLLAVVVATSMPCAAQINNQVPKDMEGVGIDQKVGTQVPLDLEFVNDLGERVTLREMFSGERPVLLSLNYSTCPMLCRLQLNSLVQTLRDMTWTTGVEYDVLSVSIDPKETPGQAHTTRLNYIEQYGRPGSASGWKFLVGEQANITTLADAVGFRYNYVPDTGEYAHSAALIVTTPDGVVARYINGVAYDASTLRLSLVEAGEGKVGSVLDQFFLACYAYDHTKGRYAPMATRIMQLGAGTTALVMGLALAPYWFRRQRRGDSSVSQTAAQPATEPQNS